ncbi:UNVERIFIED_CONTAM: hypothetical protein PYX00_011676 [Menopon gallinae]|uniref:Uncharacterized protein n=1 Tax=Menopon gallinae TaxID=328185 RepID=A0AAW2H806_9NEOP
MEGEKSAFESAADIHRLVAELRDLAETHKGLLATYRAAREAARERRFVCRQMERLSRKTRKYAKKIAALFGSSGPEELLRLDREIGALEHRLGQRRVVLEFQEQIRRKSAEQIKSFVSPRVKSLCAHSAQPLLLASLYTGDVQVWNTTTLVLKRTISVSKKPCRTAIFHEQLGYIIAGDDEGYITVTDMNGNIVSKFQAHSDFVRRVVASPGALVSCSDDCTLKSWCLKTFRMQHVFEGHTHFVMDVTPELVSVSLDCTIKFWSQNGKLKRSISAHAQGINCIVSIANMLVTGADDFTIKVWDPSPVTTISAHTNNINRIVKLHREFVSCSEDGYLKFWNLNFGLERSINLRNRVWDVAQKSGKLFVATDEALVVLEDKSEQVLVGISKDRVYHTVGAMLYYHRVSAARDAGDLASFEDGSTAPGESAYAGVQAGGGRRDVPVLSAPKEIRLDYVPSSLAASPSGKMIAFTHNSSFTVYSVLGFRSRMTGAAEEIAFVSDHECVLRGEKICFLRKGESVGKLDVRASRLFVLGGVGTDFDSADFGALGSALEAEVSSARAEGARGDALPRCGRMRASLDAAALPLVVAACDVGADLPLVLAADLRGRVYLAAWLKPRHVFRIKRNVVLCTDTQVVVISGEASAEISRPVEEGVASDSAVYIKSCGKLYCLLVADELGRAGRGSPVLYPLGSFPGTMIGVRGGSLIYFHDGRVQAQELDTEFTAWQLSVMNGVAAKPQNANKAIKFLQIIGEHESALELATDDNLRFEILVSLGRLDEALPLANNKLKYQKLARGFLRQGMYSKAAECFYMIRDPYNCYLIDFERKFRFNMGDSNLGFFMALEDGNYERCAEMLRGTVFHSLFRKSYIK